MFFVAAAAFSLVPAAIEPIRVQGMLVHPRNVLVKTTDPTCLAMYHVTERMDQIGWVVVEAPTGRLVATREALANTPGVLAATYDRAALPAYTPNDPLYSDEWHSRTIQADVAWDTSLGSSSSVVAVLDTGVQADHPDLAANIWTNAGEIPDNGIDDDNNGYVDDVHGYDFSNHDNHPDDDNGHGTACSGLVGGVGDNGIGVCGVAPRTRIMPVKVANSSGYFFDSATVPGYLYAADNGARVFSMSFYADSVSPAEEDALDYAVGRGVLPVAAAANDSTIFPYYPGAYEKVLAVAATDGGNHKAGFSDYGSWVDVAAPGVSLTTTSLGSNYTNGFAGTSGACPQVAGLAGLIFGADPSTTATRVRRAIEDTATLLNESPYGEFSAYGLVNCDAAVRADLGHLPPPTPTKVAWISPIGFAAAGKTVKARVYGRSLTKATLTVGGSATPFTRRTRSFADYVLPSSGGAVQVSGPGGYSAMFNPPVTTDYVYPLIEGSSPGATLTGGYLEGLNADGNAINITRRSDHVCLLQATFKNVPNKGKMTLVVRTRYSTTGGTETVQLYNWAGASYPYNSFTPLSSHTVADANYLVQSIVIPDIAPYVDFDHNVYLEIVGSDMSNGTTLDVDQAYLRRGAH